MSGTQITALGKYAIRGTLGKGAMGTVYDGWDPVIDRRVAIKTVRLPDAQDEEAAEGLARFKREAQAAGRLTHPNIVGVFDYGETDELAYIVMEFVDGRTLKDVMGADERLTTANTIALMEDILAGLTFSHGRGVVHRDIKPANIMITLDNRAKIADFGIARIEASSMTQAGTVLGTPAYMSPEQFMGQVVDRRTDIYSCGVLLYQLLTGDRPFEGSMTAIMHKALTTTPPRPSELVVTSPIALDAVVAKAMARRPEDRFDTAAEFAQALHAPLQESAVTSDETIVAAPRPATPRPNSPPPASPPAQTTSSKSGSKLPVFIGVGVAALAVVAGIVWFMLPGATPPVQTAQQASSTSSIPAPLPPASVPTSPASNIVTPAPVVPTPPPVSPAPTQQATLVPTIPPVPQTPSPIQRPALVTPGPALITPPPVKTTTAPFAPTPTNPPPLVAPPVAPTPAPAIVATPTLAPAIVPTPTPTPTPTPQPPPATVAPPPVVSVPTPSPFLVSPLPISPPAAPPTPPQQFASTQASPPPEPPRSNPTPPPPVRSAAAIETALAASLPTVKCSLARVAVSADGAVAIAGVTGAGQAEDALRRSVSAADPAGTAWHVQSFDGPYCQALDVLRPMTESIGHGRNAMDIAQVGGPTSLKDNDVIALQLTMPGFAGFLHVAYLQHDATVSPQVPGPGYPSQTYPARAQIELGNARQDFEGWHVGPPFGTDMIVAVASTAPLFARALPDTQPLAAYLASLQTAMEGLRRRGGSVAAAAVVLDTRER